MTENLVTIQRAARVVAPIAQHIESRYFEGAIDLVFNMIHKSKISYRVLEPPPKLAALGFVDFSNEWFEALHFPIKGIDDQSRGEWIAKIHRWIRTSLLVSRDDVIRNLKPSVGRFHRAPSAFDSAGIRWSFHQILAWIATRDILELARIDYFLFEDNAAMRRQCIGWLVLQTSLHHCKCGSCSTELSEAWETCQCVGKSYVELVSFLGDDNSTIPEFIPEPDKGSFTITWPDGATKHKVLRERVLQQWPPKSSTRIRIPDHSELVSWCTRWLESNKRQGEKPAWDDFKFDHLRKGVARDTAFRPAFYEAKDKFIKD